MRLPAPRRRRAAARDAGPGRAPLTWLFDLDNTLHDALPAIMPRINRDMNAYVARTLSVSDDEATAVRVGYWRRYGATLLGMIRHHRIDPHEFLRDTHRFPDMARLVRRTTQLAAVLELVAAQELRLVFDQKSSSLLRAHRQRLMTPVRLVCPPTEPRALVA